MLLFHFVKWPKLMCVCVCLGVSSEIHDPRYLAFTPSAVLRLAQDCGRGLGLAVDQLRVEK